MYLRLRWRCIGRQSQARVQELMAPEVAGSAPAAARRQHHHARRKTTPRQHPLRPPSLSAQLLLVCCTLLFVCQQRHSSVECQFFGRQMSGEPGAQQPPPQVLVPGSAPLLREPDRVDRIIMPNEAVSLPVSAHNGSVDWSKISYVIDHKRYVESATTRCWASTILEDPDALEPSFVIVRPGSEVRVNATAPLELVRRSGFQPQLPTKLFVHGFTQSYPSTDWLRKIRALFERNNQLHEANLIFMDWGTASHGSYSQVAARASGMGSFLANFLMKLTDELGAPRMSFHLVCHSLGAHICGFAGKRLQQPAKLGRITALDPAGPCFGKFLSNSANDRLAPRDAFEVDVYHYDDDFLGLPGQIGQFDVYVNGGSSQPGAKDNWNTMFEAFLTIVLQRNRVLSESHTRSTEVATSQLAQADCQEVAYECRDWPAFLSGECGHCDQLNSQCFLMGFPFQYQAQALGAREPLRTTSEGRRFYIATTGRNNFCLQHHQVLVQLEPDPELAQQAKRYRWRLQLELMDEAGGRVNVTMTNQLAPFTFSHLLLSDQRPVRFRAAMLQVRRSDNSVVPAVPAAASTGPQKTPLVRVTSIETNFLSNVRPQVRRTLSSRLCPTGFRLPASLNSIQDSSGDDDSDDDVWLTFEDCQRLM